MLFTPKHITKTLKNIFILLFVLSTFLRGFSQENLRINILNQPSKVKPGSHFTLFYEITSDVPFKQNLEGYLTLPNSWQKIIERKPSNQIGETFIKFFYTISIPTLEASKEYTIGFQVKQNEKVIESKNFVIEVLKNRKIEIVSLETPESVKEGDTLRIEYLVQNTGNSPEKLKISTSRGIVDPYNDSTAVQPNESIKIRVQQIIPTSDNNAWNTSADLKVFLQDSLNPISKITSIPVYSTKIKKTDPYLRFPLEAGVWFNYYQLGERTFTAFQYDFRGKGYIDWKQKHFLDFTIHGPNQFNIPAVGSFDQYTFDYTYNKKLRLQLGDYALRFTNLMELGRFGRGARIDYDFKKVGFTVFYVSPRFFPNQKETFGGSFRLYPSKVLTLSFDYLSKYTFINDRFLWANFTGVSSLIRSRKFNMDSEISLSFSDKKTDFGAFNKLLWQVGKFQINSDLIYTGKNFYGFYTNSWLSINGINYFFNRKTSISLINNITRVNPNLDLLVLNTSPYYFTNMLNFNYQINPKQRLLLSLNQTEKEDRSQQKKFHFSEEYARLAYYVNAPKFNFWYDGRVGYAENLLIKTDTSGRKLTFSNMVQPSVKVFKWLWLGGYFEHQRTNKFSLNNQLTDYLFYGGNVRFQFNNYLNAYFMYRNNYAPDELIERRSFMDASLMLDLKRHRLTFTGGKAFIPNFAQTDQNTLFFVVKYTLKLNTPLAKNKKLGSISGEVLGSNGIEKSGILIQLGDKKFLTDTSGKFYFNNLIPDKYYVSLNKSSLKTGIINETNTPIHVNVKADSSHKVMIKLTKTGGMIGKVNFINSSQIGTVDITKEKPIVLAKLSNGKENIITQINKYDEFSFKEMKTGEWKLKVWVPGKEDKYSIDLPEISIKIEENKLSEYRFNIKPVDRKIYFSNQNFELNTKNVGTDKKPKPKPTPKP